MTWRHPRSLAADVRRLAFWIGPALVITAALIAFAWTLPLMTVTRFWMWSDRISIIGALGGLWREQEYFLFAILFVFSVPFPLGKLAAGLWIWSRVDADSAQARAAVGIVQALGKWSMLDVFVVALAVVSLKITVVADVGVHSGIYVFAVGIGASMILMHLLERALVPDRPRRGLPRSGARNRPDAERPGSSPEA
jgi:paraquat-inducible protein A